MAINLELIYLRNEQHRRAFDDASIQLKALGLEKGKDSPEWKEAYEAQKKTLSVFARWDALRGK